MANMNLILQRQKAYINDLKKHINDKNIVDVVLDITALTNRSKTRLRSGNKILVAIDSNHNSAPTIYEFDSTNNQWVYKESLTANYYTQTAINGLLATERDRITALETEVGPQTNFGASTLRGRVKALEDSNFQSQIDAINAGQNLADIVGTVTLLNSYVTTNLRSGDKIQVLFDANHDNASTVYNWNGTAFEYIGKYGQDSYMKSEVYNKTENDALLLGKVDKVPGKELSTNDFTDLYKGQVDSNTSARHTHDNKSILDQVTQDVVDNEHAHTNFALLETYTQTESDLADAVSKKHSHSNKSTLDNLTQDVIDNSHTHSNKSVLDNTTASYTTEEQTKLAGIEAGAQVNIPADTILDATSNNAISNAVVTNNFNAIMNNLGGKTNFVLSYATADTNNSIFNSDNDTIVFTSSDTIKDIMGNIIPVSTMLLGDIFLVTETDKPDRWVGSVTKDANDTVISATLYKMETTKIDLAPYLTAVSYDSTNKKLTYTNNNTAHDIVSMATIKSALELGAAADKAVTNNTSATAFDSTDDNVVTNKTLYYGTPSINNSKAYTSSTSIYAPTSGGTSGQILKSAGSTSTPVWESLKTINSTSLLGSGNIDLQAPITSSNKLSSDLVDDSTATNKFVPAYTIETWTFTLADNTTVTKKVIVIND